MASDADASVWFDATSIEIWPASPTSKPNVPSFSGSLSRRVRSPSRDWRSSGSRTTTEIDRVHDYFDYPGGNPIETAAEMLQEMDAKSVLADVDGAPGVMGYRGPPLSAFLDVETQAWVRRMGWEKSEAEIDLIRESAKWANLGHRDLADFSEPGAYSATVSLRASVEASRAMLDALG